MYTYPEVNPLMSVGEFMRAIALCLAKDTLVKKLEVTAGPYRVRDVMVWYCPARDIYFVDFYSPLRNPLIRDNEGYKRFRAAYEYAVDTIVSHKLVEREALLKAKRKRLVPVERLRLEEHLEAAQQVGRDMYELLREAPKDTPLWAATLVSFTAFVEEHLPSLEKEAREYGFTDLEKAIATKRGIYEKRLAEVRGR